MPSGWLTQLALFGRRGPGRRAGCGHYDRLWSTDKGNAERMLGSVLLQPPMRGVLQNRNQSVSIFCTVTP